MPLLLFKDHEEVTRHLKSNCVHEREHAERTNEKHSETTYVCSDDITLALDS